MITSPARFRGRPSTRCSSLSLVALGRLIQVCGRVGSSTATESGTQSYQSRFGLTVDGIVGTNTWNQAQSVTTNGLLYVTASTDPGCDIYKYVGDGGRTFYLIFRTSSPYAWGFRAYGYGIAYAGSTTTAATTPTSLSTLPQAAHGSGRGRFCDTQPG